MQHILMILSNAGESTRAVDFTLNLAEREGASATALYILDYRAAQRMASHLSDTGFVGEQPTQHVIRAIEDEFRVQAEARLAEAERKFADKGITLKADLREGDFTETCLDAVRELQVDHVVICGRHMSNLKRILLGSPIDELIEQISCPVDIIDDEKQE